MAIYKPPELGSMYLSRGSVKERREQRLRANRANKLYRQDRAHRTRYKGAKDDIETANLFLLLGIDYHKTPKDQLASTVRARFEGKRADAILGPMGPEVGNKALSFLTDNFSASVVDEEGRPIIRFLPEEPEEEGESKPMRLYSQLSERTGQTRKVVREIYEALVLEVRKGLRTERVFKLPDLGRLRISYRAAKEKRKGRNPFSGKMIWFKAKPATNKLRFSPAKVLKVFVANKVEVVEPPQKKKKDKGKKKKSKK